MDKPDLVEGGSLIGKACEIFSEGICSKLFVPEIRYIFHVNKSNKALLKIM